MASKKATQSTTANEEPQTPQTQTTEPKAAGSPSDREPIDALARRTGVSPAVLSGVMAANGWVEGKRVSASELKRAVDAFLSNRMGGR